MKNSNWGEIINDSYTNPRDLLDYLNISPNQTSYIENSEFKFSVPKSFARKMIPGDISDPLLKQVLPLVDEKIIAPGFKVDAIDDQKSLKESGVVQKYQDRLLLLTSNVCAFNCRFCFRRNLEISSNNQTLLNSNTLEKLQEFKGIKEVILSGGDPLSLSNNKLKAIIDACLKIPDLKRIRIHSRILTVVPERFDLELQKIFHSIPINLVIVNHSNHANELDQKNKEVFQKLRQMGITLLNQSVLLKGVNDNIQALESLSEKLFDYGVMPYYLHQLDKAQGTKHFEVSDSKAKSLLKHLKESLAGYLVPRLVREIDQRKVLL